ncbi:MAG TPA: cytochrome c, partial [Pseudomonadales bacterium]|nr:cytochrome c [Pseudomonadales bacterium]
MERSQRFLDVLQCVAILAFVLFSPVGLADPLAVHKAEMKSGETDSTVLGKKGAGVFQRVCAACHQANGKGIPNVFPPLNDSDYLRADPVRAASHVINGLTGAVTVNGKIYTSAMPPMAYLKDDEIAGVLTYILQTWNGGGVVQPAQVAAARAGGSPPPSNIGEQVQHPMAAEEQQAYQGAPSAVPPEKAANLIETNG